MIPPMRRLMIVVLVLSATCTAARPPPPQGEPIKIGAIYSTTGGMKWFDLPGLNGFRLAADRINANGGVLGRPIEVVHVDAATDPSDTRRAVRALLARGEVVALGGLNEGTYALAPLRGALRRPDGGLISFQHSEIARIVGPVAQRAGVPLVSASSTLPDLPEAIGDMFFTMSIGAHAHVRAIADFAFDELDARSAWILRADGYDFAALLASEFTQRWRARGGRVAGEDTYPSSQAYDVSEQLSRIVLIPPDLVFLASLPNDGGHLIEQIRRAGLAMPVVSGDWFETPYIPAFAEERADGLYFSTDLSLQDPAPAMRSFVAAYTDAYGTPPEHPSAAFGYDAMRLIADAIARAGTVEPAAIRDALAQTDDFASLGGSFSYRGGARMPVESTTIVRVERGRYRFEAQVEAR